MQFFSITCSISMELISSRDEFQSIFFYHLFHFNGTTNFFLFHFNLTYSISMELISSREMSSSQIFFFFFLITTCAFVPEIGNLKILCNSSLQETSSSGSNFSTPEYHTILPRNAFLMELVIGGDEAKYRTSFKTVFFCKIVFKINLLCIFPPFRQY